MPPKRKTTAKAKKGPPAKKAKNEMALVKTTLKSVPSCRKKIHKIDEAAQHLFSGGSVVEDYDCMLNQTNIGQNNNKYYVIQLIQTGNTYSVWTRWGRVGESGQDLTLGPFTNKNDAIKAFEKKFSDKTKNKWSERTAFKAVPGKYTLLEMADDDDDDDDQNTSIEAVPTQKAIAGASSYAPSKLVPATQNLMDLIFQTNMFQHALVQLKLDTKKLPLGKLSKPQILKGFEALDEIEKVVSGKKKGNLNELSSKFYTIIPHSFGRQVPPALKTAEQVREKMDMLLVLSDIEMTQDMLKKNDGQKAIQSKNKKSNLPPHPLDVKYDMLNVDLELVDKNSNEYKIVDQYVQTTKIRKVSIINLWRVSRGGELDRFRAHKSLANHKLLWHGTNMAVVAAILKTGLRIMPHSGGRVGKGLYFASENGKSAFYVGTNNKSMGVMFLNQVALGKPKEIYRDDSSLVRAPNGFHSVVALGRTEPDSSQHKELKFENLKVTVPVGRPKQRSISTSFSQSEYLIYDESQCCIRYMVLCQF